MSTDLFATHLAQSTQSAKAAQPKTSPKQPSSPKGSRSRDESDSGSDKRDTAPVADTAGASDKPSTAKSSKAAAQAKANSASGDNSSTADDSSPASQESSAAAEASSATNSPAKGRASARSGAAKSSAQAAAAQTVSPTTDPSADASNASGLSLLQLLARSADTQDSSASSTDATSADPEPEAASVSEGDSNSASDPNVVALAMLSQALAAGFAAPPASASSAPQGSTPSGATSDTPDSVASVTDGSGKSTGTSGQQLVALLSQDFAVEAKGKSDGDAVQSDVAATKSSSDNTNAPDNTTPSIESLAQSVAQLGVASHFSGDTRTSEVKAPVGSPAWAQEIGGHLTWMAHRGLESGSLRVTPEHLGPVEVRITVQNGDASVWFGASHPDTRAALEQALPKLREMFANQGMTLTDSGVSREPPRNQTRSAASQNLSVSAIGGSDVGVESTSRVSLGLIDTYA